MRIKKAMRAKKARARMHTRVVDAVRKMSTRTMVIAVLCFLGAAMLIGAATSDVHQDQAARPQPRAAASAAPATSAASPAIETAATATTADAVRTAAARPAPVTITGCLERDDDSFRLKDTSGDNAPKARSWKSGFLRKASTSVAVVDAAKSAKLPAHVGQRVSVTGVLVGREMQVRSLQRVSASCGARG